MAKKNNQNKKRRRQSKNPIQKRTHFSDKGFLNRFKSNWIITIAGTLAIGAIINYSSLKEVYNDLFKTQPIEKFNYTNVGLIAELTRLNKEYDESNSKEAIDRITELLVYNFHTLRFQRPTTFAKIMHGKSFHNSASLDQPGNWLPYNGLTLMQLNSKNGSMTAKFEARIKNPGIDKPVPYLPFEFWWENQIVLNDRLENAFTRKSLVMSYALYRSQKSYAGISNLELVKDFNYLGISIDKNSFSTALIDMKTLKPIRPSEPPPKALLNSLLNEIIRAISGEVVETLIKIQVT